MLADIPGVDQAIEDMTLAYEHDTSESASHIRLLLLYVKMLKRRVEDLENARFGAYEVQA